MRWLIFALLIACLPVGLTPSQQCEWHKEQASHWKTAGAVTAALCGTGITATFVASKSDIIKADVAASAALICGGIGTLATVEVSEHNNACATVPPLTVQAPTIAGVPSPSPMP